jgi:phosphate transport system substrate-binding protein
MNRRHFYGPFIYFCLTLILSFTVACNKKNETQVGDNSEKLSGTIAIDGSSTVYPITEAVVEAYRTTQSNVRINIGVSGTGGGFKKFVRNDANDTIDINNASRPIKESEKLEAEGNQISFTEIPVAYDGLTVVINPKNTWATDLTSEELKSLWDMDSKIKKWNQIRASWPNRDIKLFGPGTDSGTFDYFSEAVNGKAGRSRNDYQKSEDDNVLITGVAGDVDALGYFGYAYYLENQDKLKALAISHEGKPPVLPNEQTIMDGTYAPLSRPIFIYVKNASLKRPEVGNFINFYIEKAAGLVTEVGYIPLKPEQYLENLTKVKNVQ